MTTAAVSVEQSALWRNLRPLSCASPRSFCLIVSQRWWECCSLPGYGATQRFFFGCFGIALASAAGLRLTIVSMSELTP